LPFGTTYKTLAGFSVHELHIEGIERASRQLQAEYEVGDEYLNAQAAQQIALQQRRYAPGAYDLIVMCNFLTTSELTEDFKVEIGELSRSLTPGGVLLVLGSSVPSYQELYARLNVIVADAAWLRSVAVFDGPVQAHSNDAVRGLIAAQVITGLDHARSLAPDAFATVQESLPRDVRQLDRAMVQFPKFVALAFKNEGRRPRGRWGSDRRRAKSA
jgi:hypothetical protein